MSSPLQDSALAAAAPNISSTNVYIVALGPVTDRLPFARLVEALNERQSSYHFALLDPLRNLPLPTRVDPASAGGSRAPQYEPDRLFDYIRNAEAEVLATGAVVCGVVDHEVYEGLFSTTDAENSMCLVSTRVISLPELLAIAHRTTEQYVAHEIGIQLLALRYRRVAGMSAAPSDCAAPWHVERRGDLFDYFGLTTENPQKLTHPRLDPVTLGELISAGVSERHIRATLDIVGYGTTVSGRHLATELGRDPAVLIVLGALCGLIASIAAANAWMAWVICASAAAALLIVRVLTLRRRL